MVRNSRKSISNKKQKVASSNIKSTGIKLRSWDNNNQDKKRLYNLFQTGKADPRRFNPKYISDIWKRNSWIREVYPIEKKSEFYATYRRCARYYSEEEDKAGARRCKLVYSHLYHSYLNESED